VLLNTTESRNQRVTLKLVQAKTNRDAIGSRAILKTSKRTMMRDVEAGGSYLSQNDFRLHFGLGGDEKIESLEIRWSDGQTEKVPGVIAGKIITVKSGNGISGVEEYRKRSGAEKN
jgi:hypothetical protein